MRIFVEENKNNCSSFFNQRQRLFVKIGVIGCEKNSHRFMLNFYFPTTFGSDSKKLSKVICEEF
ncbi:hypothetical protein AB674_07145 [Flavobacterium sp. ABG]|nr:hypothetical protein AB674_07145 [Flavobacterium sp. ABG]